jgi:DsbC/DsbD-like thiol-disulfide interchange protein
MMGIRKLVLHPLCSDHGEFSGLPQRLPLDRALMTIDRARTALFVGANLVLLVAAPARAADASAWDGTQRSRVRLIAGGRAEGGTALRAGIEMRLAPGWKTYWRYPGDSGIPPRFDFSKSHNVKSVTVRWEAPQRLADESGTSIGYKHDLIFPLDVVAEDRGKPVTLALAIDYGVCEKICVPVDAKAELMLDGKPTAQDTRIAAAEARVPKPATLAQDDALSVRAVKREGSRVVVDVTSPAGANVDLFAEGPTADWALPVPSPVGGAPAGQQRFTFELEGLPRDTKPDGAALLLTAVAGDRAIEVPYRLDSAN